MTSRSSFLVLTLIASGCLAKARPDGQISASPRTSEVAPKPDQSDVAGKALEPENTRGDSWETIYENCTGDDYPSGYRPPLFVRPTMQNTGVNCPDKASGCPPDATLTERTTHITAPGVYENFYKKGTLRVKASNVTLRNFEVRCNNTRAPGIELDSDYKNVVIEYGTVKKDTAPCGTSIWALSANTRISHVHNDQYAQDGIQSCCMPGPVMVERSLFTRGGDNGGYGSNAHADTWQYYNAQTGAHACWLGSRVVPSYCPNFYKISNATQSFDTNGTGKWYIYNNWIDGATNVLLGGNDLAIRNNKFGHYFNSGLYWTGRADNHGGNVWECNGAPVVPEPPDNDNSPQLTCPWGFDNDPVTGWDGQTIGDGIGPLDGQGNPFACSGTVDSRPIDPTEFCTSDGSGCVVTPSKSIR